MVLGFNKNTDNILYIYYCQTTKKQLLLLTHNLSVAVGLYWKQKLKNRWQIYAFDKKRLNNFLKALYIFWKLIK